MMLKLGDIDFGAPDANQEYSWSLKSGKPPAYMEAFVEEDIPVDEFKKGRKWIALGLKGSGKTALLRHISQTPGLQSEYILFRDEIVEEKDIFTEAFLDKSPIILQNKEIYDCKHYHHVMKRLLACIILGKMPFESANNKGLSNFLRNNIPNLVKKILSNRDFNIVADVLDSVADIVKSAQIDPSILKNKGIEVDARKILKRENDRILDKLIEEAKRSSFSANIFVDEIHFSFKEQHTFESDATLVRDLIDAATQLNNRFRKEGLTLQIYLGIRSEFLENPIISASEINNTISSVSHQMSWATMPFNKKHPCFDVIRKRISASTPSAHRLANFRHIKVPESYLANVSTDQFLRGVYGKPREAVRFFCVAKAMYPAKITLTDVEYSAVFRQYANESWGEIQTALSSFLSASEISSFETLLRKLATSTYAKQILYNDIQPLLYKFWQSLEPRKGIHDFDSLMRMLYMLGIYQTSFQATSGSRIFHSYCRGNSHPSHDGFFHLSDAVERKFR